MGALEIASPITTVAPSLVRNIISSAFMYADSSLLSLAQKHRLLQLCRSIILTSFLLVLRTLPSLFPSLDAIEADFLKNPSKNADKNNYYYVQSPDDGDVETIKTASLSFAGESGIARALSQLLSIANEIPVSSRKYEVVRSLAEKIIDDNQREGAPPLLKVNRTVLSVAFARTLCQLEAAIEERTLEATMAAAEASRQVVQVDFRFARLMWVVRALGEFARAKVGKFVGATGTGPPKRLGASAEKLMGELYWLAHKMAACGFAEEALWRWASADNLARLGITAEPRLQCCLVRISAFMFKQGKDMKASKGDTRKNEQYNQIKMEMLQTWLPLLCRATNGADVPVLSGLEKAEMERVLEETIGTLEEDEQQEKVLALWLDHFTHCSSSDWPNLLGAYLRWCDANRKLLLSPNYVAV